VEIQMKFRRFLAFTLGPAFASAVATFALVPAHADLAFKDDGGRQVRLTAPARRIVTLAPHATEILYAAGAGDRLVGTVDYSDYPPPAKALPRVGSYERLDLEAIAALKPDLVIAWETGNPAGQVDKLRALGLTVYSSQPNRMEDIAAQIERFGQLAGSEALASAAAAQFRQRLETLRRANSRKPSVRVFYQIWNNPLMTVGGPQIISDAIQLCGGENVFGTLPRMAPTVSVEAVLAANPEAIVATGMGDARPEWLNDWNKWTRMTAVKRGNLFHINPDIMQRHTPRILDGADKLCADLDVARSRRPAGDGQQ
jgi:iron complex transport system substrate-binding protein